MTLRRSRTYDTTRIVEKEEHLNSLAKEGEEWLVGQIPRNNSRWGTGSKEASKKR
jgi:hypothetical protein